MTHISSNQKLPNQKYSLPTNKTASNIFQNIQQETYSFELNTLKHFSSCIQIAPTKFVIAGGCYFSNPAYKCKNISLFET